MTKEALADKIRSLLDQHITAFIDQKSEVAQQAGKRFDELEKQKQKASEAFGEDSAAYRGAVAAIEREQKSLSVDDDTNRKANRRTAAQAVLIAANHWRLPLKLRSQPGRAASSSVGGAASAGQRTRMSSDEMEQASSKVLSVLPPANTSDDKCKAPSLIADDTNLPLPAVKSVLMKLKRDGKAQSNGRRGPAGGWRRSKAA